MGIKEECIDTAENTLGTAMYVASSVVHSEVKCWNSLLRKTDVVEVSKGFIATLSTGDLLSRDTSFIKPFPVYM